MSEFDVIVVGAGPGGYVGAIRCAQLGMKTAIVEKRGLDAGVAPKLGGTCLNVGCIPSKALIDSSSHFSEAVNHFADHGISVGKPKIDIPTMMKRKDGVVDQLTGGIAYLMKKNKISVLAGTGSLTANQGEVVVTDKDGKAETHKAKHIILATGSIPIELPFMPYDGKKIINSDHAIALPKVPKKLVIVGGGVIGLELGSVWASLGAEVDVVEFLPQICPFLDKDVAGAFQKILAKQGLKFHLSTKVTACDTKGKGVKLSAEGPKGEELTFEGDHVLVAVGRRPVTEGCGLEAAGVELNERKRIAVDASFATNVPGVYAIGDVIDGPMLAHKAEEEGVALAELLAGEKPHIDHDLIPGVVYTHPEVANVGKGEAALKEAGVDYVVGKFAFMANGRAKAAGENDGFVKILADKKTDRVLGASVLGPRASDLLAEIVAVMAFGGASEDIARICHSHPTFSEAVKEAALDCLGRAIHS